MSTRWLMTVAGLAILAAVAGGCRPAAAPQQAASGPPTPNADISGEITVFVPCGVAGPYGEIKAAFMKKYPGVTVKQELANIDVQTKLLEDGKATPDAWIALGDQETKRIQKTGRIDGEPVTFAYNSLALMVARNNPLNIESLEDLAKPEVKTIALASPENSSGFYAEQAFRKVGVWDKIQSKLWVTDQPAMIKTQLAAGKAEVGVVYYPCAREAKLVGGKPQDLPGKVQLLNKLPEDVAARFPVQAAVIKGAANPKAARAFLEFMLTQEGQDIWEAWTFDRAKEVAGRVALYCYCGAGIRPMMDAAVDAFKQRQPNTRIDVGYAGSGCLLSQLAFGKRGDLYVPGEDFYLDQARSRDFIASAKPVGSFEPVLLVGKGNPKGIKTVADLTRPGVRVALGEPQACAVGLAAGNLLKKAGLAEKVQKNVRLLAGNVPELGNAVKLGTIDVAIVWNVTAAQQAEDCDSVAIDRKLYEPSRVQMALLKFSKHTAEAQAFIDFLASPEGQKIVGGSGMSPIGQGSQPAGS